MLTTVGWLRARAAGVVSGATAGLGAMGWKASSVTLWSRTRRSFSGLMHPVAKTAAASRRAAVGRVRIMAEVYTPVPRLRPGSAGQAVSWAHGLPPRTVAKPWHLGASQVL